MYEQHTPSQGRQFIEDIRPSKLRDKQLYFNVRDDRVRQHSIGSLDDKYTALRGISEAPIADTDATKKTAITFVPPLRNLGADGYRSITEGNGTKDNTLSSLVRRIGTTIGTAGLFIGSRLRNLPWLPKKYRLSRGVYTNWHTRTLDRVRWTIPAMVILGGVTASTLLWQVPAVKQGMKSTGEQTAKLVSSAMPGADTPNSDAGTSPSGSNQPTQNSSASSPSISWWTAPAVNQPTVTSSPADSSIIPVEVSPITGGQGGGDSGGTGDTTPVITIPPITDPTDPSTDPTDPTTDPTNPLDPVIEIINQPLQTVTSTVDQIL